MSEDIHGKTVPFVDLQPSLLGMPYEKKLPKADTIETAKGIMFLCPVCFLRNEGVRGTHSVICWSADVPQDFVPKPGRWNMSGIWFHNLSLHGTTSDSVDLSRTLGDYIVQGCRAHFFVKNGTVKIV